MVKSNVTKAVSDVPFWAAAHLGKSVQLLEDFWEDWGDGQGETYPAGFVVTLVEIRTTPFGSFAVVDPGPDRTADELDVPFKILSLTTESVSQACLRIPGRAGEIASLWANGVDLRARLTYASFYRYRRELLSHGLDIGAPLSPPEEIASTR
jgi:hypothetical protein